MSKRINYVLLLVTLLFSGALRAQETVSSSKLLHQMHQLKSLGKVLYIAAHPDDENTRLISYLTQHEHLDVSYLSLTRGDGGQNLIGTEIGEQLGLLRSHELMAARRIDGGKQYFTRAIDFGYSKTPEETFEFWNYDQVLSDVVYVIRKIQPDVIITRFSPDVNPNRPTHGHHTASAMLAKRAFKAAADPNQFPEQLNELEVWQTKDIYWNTSYWFYGSVEEMDKKVAEAPDKYIKVDVNPYLNLLGKSTSDISSLSRSQHKSQGFGNAPVLEPQWEYLVTLEDETTPNYLFEHINRTWADRVGNKKLDKLMQKLIDKYDVSKPANSIPLLFEIRDGLVLVDNKRLIEEKVALVDQLILQASGVKLQATTGAQLICKGQKIKSQLKWYDPLGKVNVDAISLTNPILSKVKGEREIEFEWMVPEDVSSQPYWLRHPAKQGFYVLDSESNRGKDFNDYPFNIQVTLIVEGRLIVVDVPIEHAETDPVKGLITQPLVVVPVVTLNPNTEVKMFAGNEARAVEITATAHAANQEGYVELLLPDGWKSEPAFYKTSFEHPGIAKLFSFTITPPKGESQGDVKAIFKTNDGVYPNSFYQLDYDHIPAVAAMPEAKFKVVKVNIKHNGESIAYIKGAGDKVAEAIEEMGYKVTFLTVEEAMSADLSAYQAVVLGIRALNVLPDIGNLNDVLTSYVKHGGNLVMQYNTSHRLKAQPLGPYKLELSRDRVTEEDAIVTLDTSQIVLKAPNQITASDFDHWVQERGLYFPKTWDKEIKPVLTMNDTNDTPKQGSLLVGAYGKGHVVYTGLSFFRELPAGVPGAYKLLANILSL